MNLKRSKIFVCIHLIILICYIIADYFFNEDAERANHSLVIKLQNSETTQLNNFLAFISQIGDGPFYLGITLFLFWLVPDKLQIVIFLFFFCFNASFNNILKIIYSKGRPFLLYEDVKAINCETSFGKPSGHSQVGVLFYIFISDFIFNQKILNKKWIIRYFISFICYLIFLLIGFSRVYLGVHSFNQVLLGWMYGLFITNIYFCSNKSIKDFCLAHYENEKNTRSKKYPSLFIIIVFYLLYLGIIIFIYSLIDHYTEIPNIWLIQLNNKCPKHYYINNLFINRDFLETSVGSASFGIILALYFSNGIINEKSKWAFHRVLEWWKWILRFVVIIILGISLAIIVYLIENNETNVYLLFFFKFHFPFALFSFSLVYFLPILYRRLNIGLSNFTIERKMKNSKNPNLIDL